MVLIGVAGSGKSYWAAGRFRSSAVVSSDALREIVGSGPADLDASTDAFTILDAVVGARARRRLTTVIDTLGLDPGRRRGYLRIAREAGMLAVAVVIDTPEAVCRARNSRRDRPVPASVLTDQWRRRRLVGTEIASEGWDLVVTESGDGNSGTPVEQTGMAQAPSTGPRALLPPDGGPPSVVLQVSRFPDKEPLAPWLVGVAERAEQVGFTGLALMDHLIQIPQVGRAWEPIPEPWVALGALAVSTDRLQLGTLVSPIGWRSGGLLAKSAATLDALSGGRAFCGIGAGWWDREHLGFGLEMQSATERLDSLAVAAETMRALWAPGTKAYRGRYVELPETTCYPRPAGALPLLIGGSGRRTLRIAAELADGINVPSSIAAEKAALLRRALGAAGRATADCALTVLDIPILGRSADDVGRLVERLRGRTAATTFAARHHADVAEGHLSRYRELVRCGVRAIFLAVPDLAVPDDLDKCAPLLNGLASF